MHCRSSPGTAGSAASQAPPGRSAGADPWQRRTACRMSSMAPSASCAGQQAGAVIVQPSPYTTTPHWVWVSGALQEQPRHSWQRRIAGTPWSRRRRRPPAVSHLCRLCSAVRAGADCPATTLHSPSVGLGEWRSAQAAQAALAAPHLQAPPGPAAAAPPPQRSAAPAVQDSGGRGDCPTTTPHSPSVGVGEWPTPLLPVQGWTAVPLAAAARLLPPPAAPLDIAQERRKEVALRCWASRWCKRATCGRAGRKETPKCGRRSPGPRLGSRQRPC